MQLLHGDCRSVMRELPESSVDAIVTDPPYGLEFMGKEWDKLATGRGAKYSRGGQMTHTDFKDFGTLPSYVNRPAKRCGNCGKQAWSGSPCKCDEPRWIMDNSPLETMQSWHESWAREAYRVLKPGGHLLAFGGSRTYHRLACAVEDAGFEIRDQLQWLYGSGFPKSLDVSKAMDKARKDDPDWMVVGAWLKRCRVESGLSAKAVCAALGFHGDVNHGGAVSNWENGFSCPTWDQWLALKNLLIFGDEMDAEVWRLNGRKGQPGEAWYEREVVGKDGRTANSSWLGSQDGVNNTWGIGEWALTAPATDLARQWDGWGTALKPAHEPIVLARKPLIGTVSANVSEHGTGALNIDGCRIEGSVPSATGQGFRSGKYGGQIGHGDPTLSGVPWSNTTGRWPSNVILGHAPECREVGVKRVKGSHQNGKPWPRNAGHQYDGGYVGTGHGTSHTDPDGYETVTAWECHESCPIALLDAQSGERGGSGGAFRKGSGDLKQWRTGNNENQPNGYADTGGASRFFLNVKSDTDDAWYICESDGIVSHIDDLVNGCPECGATMVPYRVPIEGDEARFRYEAKASRAERNAGLDGMPERAVRDSGAEFGKMSMWNGENGDEAWKAKNPNKPTANHHPTVKPIAVMRWLVRLITPPGGTVLDPFMGSGTTGIAAALEGFDFIGVEQDAEYLEIARRRIAHWTKAPDMGPLFAMVAD